MTRAELMRRFGIYSGIVVVGASASLGVRAWEQGVFTGQDAIAYEPWQNWRTYHGPRALVAAAILAANAHDFQPWIFHIADDRIDLYADLVRNIGAADPFDREMDIGLGCALENLVLAAAPNGYSAEVTLLPEAANPAHVARIQLTSRDGRASSLYEQIPRRHSNRGPFDRTRDLSPGDLQQLAVGLERASNEARIVWFVTPSDRRMVGDLLIEATQAFIADEAQSRASYAGLRSGPRDIALQKDGITLDAQGLSTPLTALVKLLPTSSRSAGDAFWLATTRDTHVATAAAFGMVVVKDPSDRAQRLVGGRLLQRIHLAATQRGIALQHMNQLTERADRERSLGIAPRFGDALRALVRAPWSSLSTFRLGYPLRVANASPRRSVEDVLHDA